MLGPLPQADPKKRTNQAITVNECMNVMRKRAGKARFNNFGKFTPNFRKNRTKFKLTKPLIHLLRKTKNSLKNLMTGYIELHDKLKN